MPACRQTHRKCTKALYLYIILIYVVVVVLFFFFVFLNMPTGYPFSWRDPKNCA